MISEMPTFGVTQGSGVVGEITIVADDHFNCEVIPNWTNRTAKADGIVVAIMYDNYNNVQWRNTTKGTSGYFTNATSGNWCYAEFEVSNGDSIGFYSASSATRHIALVYEQVS